MTLLMFIRGCCFFREWKGCQTAFLLFLCYLTFLFTNNHLQEMPQRNSICMISKHFAFSSFGSFAQSFLRPAVIFSFAPVGLSLSLILSHNLIPTLNCPLKAPLHPSVKPCRPTLTNTKSQGLCITQSSA